VSGSDVYVNGTLLKRGENNDYTIDYNAEIVFTPLFTITSEMRIAIEYQFSDLHLFCHHAGATHDSKKWSFGGYLYSEMMSKPTLATKFITGTSTNISKCRDNPLMTAPSAYMTPIQKTKYYIKTVFNAVEIFEYSNDAQQELFNVRFTLVGTNIEIT
jgi:hypothetical protein